MMNKNENQKTIFKINSICLAVALCLFYTPLFLKTLHRELFSGFCSIVPNDTYYSASSAWHISKIEADKAWEITTGTNRVSVGIIDSGIDFSIADLEDNLDDEFSHDFYSSNRNAPLVDIVGHGTKVASVFGARGNNQNEIAGLCWHSNIVSMRIDGSNGIDADSMISAFNYASYYNIPILNISSSVVFGQASSCINSTQISYLESAIMNYPGLIVVAAGNSGINLDYNNTFYPQCLDYQNMIVVGASNNSDECLFNYGANRVDLLAPGINIPSLPIDENSSLPFSFSGTSASAPLVTATALLIKSVNPSLTTSQIKSTILDNVDYIPQLSNLCLTGGRLNVYKSVKAVIPEYSSFGYTLNGAGPIDPNQHRFHKMNLSAEVFYFDINSTNPLNFEIYDDLQSSPLAIYNLNSCNSFFSFNNSEPRTIYLKIKNDGTSTANYSLNIYSE